MFSYIVFGVLIIVLLALIYWAFFNDKRKRKRSEAMLKTSTGCFDENARRALKELEKIGEPAADDHFRHGDIIRYNILEGNARARGRDALTTQVMRDYTNTLRGLQGRVRDVGADRDIPPIFMVDRIEDFNNNLLQGDVWDDGGLAQFFNNAVITHAPAVRQEIIEDRREKALAAASTRAEAIEKYFDSATKYTDDRQNVHDSKVNADLRGVLRRLRDTAPMDFDPHSAIEEAKDFINGEYAKDPLTANKARNALNVLAKVREGDTISTFHDSEDRIFAYTWERCKHPRNARNERLMKEAVVTALADSVENGGQVCINGRCGRVLNSLVTLDFDRAVSESGALTLEAYKNQIFQETKELIEQEIERAKNSADPAIRAVGAAYETGDPSTDVDAETRFKSDVKAEIDRNVDKYADKLSDNERENIKQECYVYATI